MLITGGTGFVGLALAERLRATGIAVRLFDNVDAPSHFLAMPELAGLETRRGDIRVDGDIAAAMDADVEAVVHMAAITPDRHLAREDPGRVTEVNVTGTARLLRAMRDRASRARLLLVSSVAVYGSAEPVGDTYDEARSVPVPESLYGITKYAAERLAERLAADYEIELVTARLGPVFGPWEHFGGARPLLSPQGQILELAARGAEAVLPWPMTSDWLYSRDAGNALAALLTEPDPPHTLYNIGGGAVWTVADWCARAASHFVGLRWRLAGAGEEANVQLATGDRPSLAIERLHTDLALAPAFILDEAVEDHCRWLRRSAASVVE